MIEFFLHVVDHILTEIRHMFITEVLCGSLKVGSGDITDENILV